MLIGITGGIGSGKSTIAHALSQRGWIRYDCDREAKRIITENTAVRKAIIDLLGTEAFTTSPAFPFTGIYNTAYVSRRVFAEPKLLGLLNAIIHPAVKRDIEEKRNSLPPETVLLVESAILHEAGLDEICDFIIVVDAPEEIRIQRTIARDYQGLSTPENIEKVRARIRTQKIPSGDLVIHNDGTRPIHEIVEEIPHDMCKN